jgi:hypothetical protein
MTDGWLKLVFVKDNLGRPMSIRLPISILNKKLNSELHGEVEFIQTS